MSPIYGSTAEIYYCGKDGKTIQDFPCGGARDQEKRGNEPRSESNDKSSSDLNRKAMALGFRDYKEYSNSQDICISLYNRLGNSAQTVVAWKMNKCEVFYERVPNPNSYSNQGGVGKNRFEVYDIYPSCPYFIIEQGYNIAVVQEFSCSQKSVYKFGTGNASGLGTKSLMIGGRECRVFVEDCLLSPTSAKEKLAERCSPYR